MLRSRHHLAGEAAERGKPARAVEQHVLRPDVAQGLEPGGDLLGGAEEGPRGGGLPGVGVGHGAGVVLAVGPLGQPVDPAAPGDTGVEGLLQLRRRPYHVHGAGDPHAQGIEHAAAGLDLRLEERDALADLGDRRELVQQQVVPARAPRGWIEAGLPRRPCQSARVRLLRTVGGSTTTLSNCQYLP